MDMNIVEQLKEIADSVDSIKRVILWQARQGHEHEPGRGVAHTVCMTCEALQDAKGRWYGGILEY